MKTLLTITAVLEAVTGVALAAAPSRLVVALLGAPLDSPASLVIAQILGAALFSLGIARWLARDNSPSPTTVPTIAAMLVYNVAVVGLLAHSRIGLGISGVGHWPGVILHSALAVWCVACLGAARNFADGGTFLRGAG